MFKDSKDSTDALKATETTMSFFGIILKFLLIKDTYVLIM